jgi:prevent-host-death family protein
MREIGIRELKVHASQILRRVRESQEEVPITYRGKVVAHVVPAETYEKLKAGIPDFWDALREFRASTGGARLGDVFAGVRDRSKGRRFSW